VESPIFGYANGINVTEGPSPTPQCIQRNRKGSESEQLTNPSRKGIKFGK